MYAMTTDENIEQQARREAEAKYPTHYGQRESWAEHIATFEREAYAAALIAERSKPQPSVDIEVIQQELEAWLKTCGSPIPCHDEYMDDLRDRLTKLFKP